MREQRVGVDRTVGQIEGRGELMAFRTCELKTFCRHGYLHDDGALFTSSKRERCR
jgi:hypothetical protein